MSWHALKLAGTLYVRFAAQNLAAWQKECPFKRKSGELICTALARQEVDDGMRLLPLGDTGGGVTDILDHVILGIARGEGLSEQQKAAVARFLHAREERATLVEALLQTNDYQRMTRFLRVREELENGLLRAASRGDLTTEERLALYQLVESKTSELQRRTSEAKTGVPDLVELLDKVDYTLAEKEKEMAVKLSGTSGGGRDMIRRAAFRLNKLRREAEKA